MVKEIKKIITDSEIMTCNDENWPHPDKIGMQKLDVRIGNEEINFRTSKIGSYSEVRKSKGKLFILI